MSSIEYNVGNLVRVTGSFVDDEGVAVDPTTITFYYESPSKTTTSFIFGIDEEIIKEGVGVYYCDILITESGRWNYRFKGEGSAVAADESWFLVVPLIIEE